MGFCWDFSLGLILQFHYLVLFIRAFCSPHSHFRRRFGLLCRLMYLLCRALCLLCSICTVVYVRGFSILCITFSLLSFDDYHFIVIIFYLRSLRNFFSFLISVLSLRFIFFLYPSDTMLTDPTSVGHFVQQHAASKLVSIGNSLLHDEGHSTLMLRLMATSVPSENRRNAMLNNGKGFLAFDSEGILRAAICIKCVASGAFVVSLNDAFDQVSPVTFDPTTCGATVMTLVAHSEVTALELPHLDPQVYEPGNADPPEDADPNRSIHWDGISLSDSPVFALIPKLFPVLPGANLPSTFRLSDDLPADSVSWPMSFRHWIVGMRYLYKFNEFKSLHSTHVMFNANACPMESFGDFLVAESPVVTLSTVNVTSPDHTFYLGEFKTFRQFYSLEVTQGDQFPVGTPPPNSPSLGSSQATILQDLASVLGTKSSTHSERETIKNQLRVEASYTLMFSRFETITHLDGTQLKEVIPTPLSSDYKEFISATSLKHSLSTLQSRLHQYINRTKHKGGTSNVFALSTEFDADIIQHAFASQLRSFGWCSDSMVLYPERASRDISLIHFLPSRGKSVSYTNYLLQGQRIMLQEAMDEDKSRVTAKKTDLFFHGKLDAFADVVSTLSNFFMFVAFCTDDQSNEPTVIRLLKEYFDCMYSNVGRRWVQMHVETHTHLLLRLLLDCNAIIQPFVELSMNPDCIDCALSKTAIKPTFMDEAIARASFPKNNLMNCATSGDLNQYSTVPELWTMMYPEKIFHPTPSPGVETPPAKKHKPETPGGKPKGKPTGDKPKNKPPAVKNTPPNNDPVPGILVWTGNSPAPVPNFQMVHPVSNVPKKLCRFFTFQGLSCSNGQNCQNVHLSNANRLDNSKQGELKAFVAETPGLDWAPGKMPTEG